MRFSGLKASIAGTLVILLSAALVLGNVVTVVFWQKSLVHAEIAKAQAVIGVIEELFETKIQSGKTVSVEDLKSIVEKYENFEFSILYYDGRKTLQYPVVRENNAFEQTVRNSGLNQQEIVTVKGTQWAIVSFGGKSLIVAQPVLADVKKNSALGLAIELEPVYQAVKNNLKVLLVYLLVNGIILSVIGLFRMFSLVVKPIERLASVSESYQVSDTLAFTGVEVGSEFSQLSMALNSMLLKIELDRKQLKKTVDSLEEANTELVRTQKEMVQAEKLAAVGRLSAGLAHEIGNPLGIIQGYVELLQHADISAEDKKQFAGRALSELDRINRLIRQLLDFARATPQPFEEFSLNSVLMELQEMFATQHSQLKIKLLVEIEGDCVVEGDRDGIKQVLLNCLLNASDSIDLCTHKQGGKIQISVTCLEDRETIKNILIRIEDSGIGIRDDQQALLFEPFYSTKDSQKGTGLGLSVSHSIIERHGGKMWIEGEEGKGAVVSIEIPQKQAVEA